MTVSYEYTAEQVAPPGSMPIPTGASPENSISSAPPEGSEVSFYHRMRVGGDGLLFPATFVMEFGGVPESKSCVAFTTDTNVPGDASVWSSSGSATVQIRIAAFDRKMYLNTIHIARVNASDVVQETIGSLLSINRPLDANIFLSWGVTISATSGSPATSDRLLLVLGFYKNAKGPLRTVGLRFNTSLVMPWTITPGGAQTFGVAVWPEATTGLTAPTGQMDLSYQNTQFPIAQALLTDVANTNVDMIHVESNSADASCLLTATAAETIDSNLSHVETEIAVATTTLTNPGTTMGGPAQTFVLVDAAVASALLTAGTGSIADGLEHVETNAAVATTTLTDPQTKMNLSHVETNAAVASALLTDPTAILTEGALLKIWDGATWVPTAGAE